MKENCSELFINLATGQLKALFLIVTDEGSVSKCDMATAVERLNTKMHGKTSLED